ncbi:MAG: FkbM family methyltransferase [Betaproteobacteria bacterium]
MKPATSKFRNALIDEFKEAATDSRKSISASKLNSRPIVIYGAGECSHWFHEIAMKRHGCRPIAVLDRAFSTGSETSSWEGIPGFSPDTYVPEQDLQQEAYVVVCVGNRAHHADILECLTKLGFRNVVFLHDIYEIHNPFDQPKEAAELGLRYYTAHQTQILAAFDLLADEESQKVYYHFLQTHMHRTPVEIPQRPRQEQYFPTDIPLSQGHSCYVCCGAYDGDTLRLLHKLRGKVDTIACFEPEPHIYGRLTDFLERQGTTLAERILTWPCAVYDHSGQMPFIPGDGLGSRISNAGLTQVQCVTLDQSLVGLNPTFISMDVEGVEPEVLHGAEQLLKRCAPDLGICVYHSANHVWEIPLYLHTLGLGYRFYLRNYTGFAIETVLYASR